MGSLYACKLHKDKYVDPVEYHMVESIKCAPTPSVRCNDTLYGPTMEKFNPCEVGESLGEITSEIIDGLPTENFQTNCHYVGDVIYSYGDGNRFIVVNTKGRYYLYEKD